MMSSFMLLEDLIALPKIARVKYTEKLVWTVHSLRWDTLHSHMKFLQVWRYNLFSQEWMKMDAHGDFPTALASFACQFGTHCSILANLILRRIIKFFFDFVVAQSSPYSNQVLLFGGTAVPFGATTSSSVHLLSFDSDSNSLVSTVLPVEGEKLATYGHVSF